MVNYLAVLVASIVAMAFGAFWYSPVGVGKTWMKLMGITQKMIDESKDKSMTLSYIINFVAVIISAIIMSILFDLIGVSTPLAGAGFGALIWLGFIGTTTISSVIWEKRPIKLYILNNLYMLINYVIIGIILAVWK